MGRSLPSLNSLRAFEAAARHLSFKLAADELNVTPAAVSHQVKALEETLGVELFRRMTRAIKLTHAGQAALPLIADGFDNLSAGVAVLREHSKKDLLTVSVSPSFGSIWLVPRLARFRQKFPDIAIRIDGTDRLADIASGDADVAIRYGAGGYEDVTVDHLFSQLNTPICSPALLEGETALLRPEDLAKHTLLHIEWKETEASWRMWLLAAGLTGIDPNRGPLFTQESMAIQAALDGHGVALVGDKLVADHLEAGRLICPFRQDMKMPLTFSYYLLSQKTKRPKVEAFREWIISEATESDTIRRS